MNEELKPCPFCGGTVSISFHGSKPTGYWWSINRGFDKNTKCTCRLFMESDKFDCFNARHKEERKQKLIEKWNTRCSDKNIEGHDKQLLEKLNEFLVEEKGEYVGSDIEEFLEIRKGKKNE